MVKCSWVQSLVYTQTHTHTHKDYLQTIKTECRELKANGPKKFWREALTAS